MDGALGMSVNWNQVERQRDEIDRAVEWGEMTPEEGRREHRDLDREIADLEREQNHYRGWR